MIVQQRNKDIKMTCSLEKCNGSAKGQNEVYKNVQSRLPIKKQAIQMKQTWLSYGSYVMQLVSLGFQRSKRVCRLYNCFCFPLKVVLICMNT